MMIRGTRQPGGIDRKRLIVVGALTVALLIAIGAGLYMAVQRFEEGGGGGEEPRGDLGGRFQGPDMPVHDGQRYQARSGLTTLLFMGVDSAEEQSRADFLLLLVIDPKKEVITPFEIDRDTLAEMPVAESPGNPAGTRTAPLGLAYGVGEGGKQGARHVADAVSKLLLGVGIDHYMAINLDGVAVLNDLLGGVTVTLEDDFSTLDPAMAKGETLTLRGVQAERYVWGRLGGGDEAGTPRMARLKNYLGKAGAVTWKKLRENAGFMGTLFDGLAEILITDMTRGRMINMVFTSRNYLMAETVSLPGAYSARDDGSVAFHADESALEQWVLEVFCEPAGGGQ